MTRMPRVTARELVRFLKGQGFVEDRESFLDVTLVNGHGWLDSQDVQMPSSKP